MVYRACMGCKRSLVQIQSPRPDMQVSGGSVAWFIAPGLEPGDREFKSPPPDHIISSMIHCKKCCKSEAETAFQFRTVNGRKYPRHLCSKCFNKYNSSLKRKSGKHAHHVRRNKEKVKSWRRNNQKTAMFILQDSRHNDKRRSHENNLDRGFIETEIKGGCKYCGENGIRITLDRIDNSKGHTKDNVIAACIRCNLVRGSMPYAAWLIIVPAMKSAREQGLFEGWVCRRPGRKSIASIDVHRTA